MMGQQFGFNMTTPEDVEAFQQQYNDNPESARADWVANAVSDMMQAAVSYQPKSKEAKKPKTGFGKKPDRKKQTARRNDQLRLLV